MNSRLIESEPSCCWWVSFGIQDSPNIHATVQDHEQLLKKRGLLDTDPNKSCPNVHAREIVLISNGFIDEKTNVPHPTIQRKQSRETWFYLHKTISISSILFRIENTDRGIAQKDISSWLLRNPCWSRTIGSHCCEDRTKRLAFPKLEGALLEFHPPCWSCPQCISRSHWIETSR